MQTPPRKNPGAGGQSSCGSVLPSAPHAPISPWPPPGTEGWMAAKAAAIQSSPTALSSSSSVSLASRDGGKQRKTAPLMFRALPTTIISKILVRLLAADTRYALRRKVSVALFQRGNMDRLYQSTEWTAFPRSHFSSFNQEQHLFFFFLLLHFCEKLNTFQLIWFIG